MVDRQWGLRRLSTRIAVGLLALGLAPAAWSAAGVVEGLTGSASIERAALLQPAAIGAEVESGDAVVTAAESALALRMDSGDLIYVSEDTRFQVSDYTAPEPTAPVGRSLFSLWRGGFRAVTAQLGDRDLEAFRVATPVATIGIRGTVFSAQLADDGLYLGVDEGLVQAVNNAGVFDVAAGEFVFIPSAILPPVRLKQRPTALENQMPPPAATAGVVGAGAAGAASSATVLGANTTLLAGALAAVGVVAIASSNDDDGGDTATTGTSATR